MQLWNHIIAINEPDRSTHFITTRVLLISDLKNIKGGGKKLGSLIPEHTYVAELYDQKPTGQISEDPSHAT